MHPGLLLVFDGLATYRLTRLVVRDDFPPIRYLREGVGRWARAGADSPTFRRREALYDLVTCHWCASGWIAAGLTVRRSRELRGLGVDLLAYWLAVWAVGAGLAHLEPEK